MSINGYFYYGKVIVVYEEVPLKICVTHCRTYSECRSFNMKWINPSRTFGTCALLQEVTLTSTTTGAINDENYTYYYWCPENMTYYLGTGVCVANKTGVTWYEGDVFCKGLYPGAHLIDIKSEEEQLAYLPLFDSFIQFWTSAKRPVGGDREEFYWTNSGERVTYTNWGSKEPNRGTSTSDCVRLKKSANYTWSDHKCVDDRVTALCFGCHQLPGIAPRPVYYRRKDDDDDDNDVIAKEFRNIIKTSVLGSTNPCYEYCIINTILEAIIDEKDLGVTIDRHLNFHVHISKAVNKPSRKLFRATFTCIDKIYLENENIVDAAAKARKIMRGIGDEGPKRLNASGLTDDQKKIPTELWTFF
ncbi:hypothetical protein LSH36_1131g00009 [Paralvinella palmiformis]|uniref:C-type lectin domain-containing protein n=1 Tax=Paralvinella palmiformis TaxID=53620 RepID=A0AAD9MRL3_9ANNE|nr:hypothetical protein LSH36_1131g00009 [Paralvinella palmiformis]